MKIPVFDINNNLLKSENFFKDARDLIRDDDHLYFLISSIIDTYRIRQRFQKLGNLDDFDFNFLDQGYVKNIRTGEFFGLGIKPYHYDDSNVFMKFDLNLSRETKKNDISFLGGWDCEYIFITPLSSKNPKIYLREDAPSTDEIKRMGIPIHMSKGSQKFKSRPYVWANDIFKRSQSRIWWS